MSTFRIDDSSDKEVEQFLQENNMFYSKHESAGDAYARELLEEAVVVYPEFAQMDKEQLDKIAKELVEKELPNHAGIYFEKNYCV